MKEIILNRDFKQDKQTLGVCYIKDNNKGVVVFKSEAIERGWKDNQRMISCIPDGTYSVVLEYSDRFKTMLWEIKGVPNRSECKFHAANYARQLNGCIALGNNRKDIDGDGYHDVTSSRTTMAKFHKAMGPDHHARLIVKSI